MGSQGCRRTRKLCKAQQSSITRWPSNNIAVIECQIQLLYIASSSILNPFLEAEMDETILERGRARRVLDPDRCRTAVFRSAHTTRAIRPRRTVEIFPA